MYMVRRCSFAPATSARGAEPLRLSSLPTYAQPRRVHGREARDDRVVDRSWTSSTAVPRWIRHRVHHENVRIGHVGRPLPSSDVRIINDVGPVRSVSPAVFVRAERIQISRTSASRGARRNRARRTHHVWRYRVLDAEASCISVTRTRHDHLGASTSIQSRSKPAS